MALFFVNLISERGIKNALRKTEEKMKNIKLVVAALLLTLCSCKDLTGSLSVSEVISLKSDQRDTIQVQPGTYSGAIKVNSKKKINLELSLPNGKSTFIFKTSQNLKDLKSGDRIQVSAATSGQPYDIDGVYLVNTSSSDSQRSNESCTYTTQEYRCRNETTPQVCQIVKECDPNNAAQCQERKVCTGGESRQVCGNESVSHQGQHDVEFYTTTTTESVQLQLISEQRSLSQFSGSDSESNKHYSFQGICQ